MSFVQLPSSADHRKFLKNKRKNLSGFLISLVKKLQRCKRLRLDALKEILPDLVQRLKSNSCSKLEIIDDVAKLWTVLNDLEKDPTVSSAAKSRARGLTDWLTKIYPSLRKTFNELYSLHEKALRYQIVFVRSMKTYRTSRTELEAAEERLKALKAEYLSDTGTEWSDVREEGPIILTRNAVNGDEISPELSDIVKQLKRDEAMRYIKM